MTDTQETNDTQSTTPARPFPSGSQAQKVTRKALTPFQSEQRRLMMKEEALRTMSRQEAFDRGYLTVKDLDDEELRYGRCRDKNTGVLLKDPKKTQTLPQEQYDEMIREHELRFNQKLRQNLDDMVDGLVSLAKDDTVEPRDRIDAMKYVIDRTAGKATEKLQVTVHSAPYEELLNEVTGIGAISRADHRRISAETNGQAGIIDVEYTDEANTSNQDEDDAQPSQLQTHGEDSTEQTVVPVLPLRPSEQNAEPHEAAFVGQEPIPGEQYYEYVDIPTGPDTVSAPNNTKPATPEPRQDDPYTQSYGSKRTETNNYADQARAAQDLARRRKENKERIKNATKFRKIARTQGQDATTDSPVPDITGATLAEDGRLTFE